jgi:hypothetical protein
MPPVAVHDNRFGDAVAVVAPHYWLPPAVPRPQAPHGFTPRSLLAKRWREATTPIAISSVVLLPYLIALNRLFERNIADARDDTMDMEMDLAADALEAAKLTAATALDTYAKMAVHTLIAAKLVQIGGPLCNDVVLHYDIGQRLTGEYLGRLLAKLHLPPSWASVMGPMATPADLKIYEAPVSAFGAAQDALKRNFPHVAASAVVGITSRVVMFASPTVRRCMAGRTKVEIRPSSEDPTHQVAVRPWSELAPITRAELVSDIFQILSSHAQRLVVAVAGSAVGSMLGGGRGGATEFWCETILAHVALQVVATSCTALRAAKLHDAATKRRAAVAGAASPIPAPI